MSTSRHSVCKHCGKKVLKDRLFDTLYSFTKGRGFHCLECNTSCQLLLEFPFGLNAGSYEYQVIGCYLPDKIQQWKDSKGDTVEFFPFLVILEDTQNKKKAIWQPYWHGHHQSQNMNPKYGQWATCMDIEIYKQLLEKAKDEGYL